LDTKENVREALRRMCAKRKEVVLRGIRKCDILLKREKTQKTLDLSRIGRKIAQNAQYTRLRAILPDCGQNMQDSNRKNCCWNSRNSSCNPFPNRVE